MPHPEQENVELTRMNLYYLCQKGWTFKKIFQIHCELCREGLKLTDL